MNQLENTPENKAAFFSLYYQQEVFSWKDNINSPTALEGGLLDMVRGGNFDDALLELRSIDSLTDEEISRLRSVLHIPDSFELVLRKKGDFIVYKPNGEYYPTYAEIGLIAIDYLRKISVFIPYMGESDKLIEWGWVKILK